MNDISDSRIKEAIDYVNEETSKPDSELSFKHVKGMITFDFVKDAVIAFSEGKNLTSVYKNHGLTGKRNNYATYILYYIIPYIFSKEEIRHYCFDKFKEYGHFKKTVDWNYVYIDKLYETVFDVTFNNKKHKKSILMKSWKEASEYYKKNYLYADDFIERVIDDIRKRNTLKDAYKIHSLYYCKATFYSFDHCLGAYILPAIGDDEFVHYLNDMSEKFISDYSDNENNSEYLLIGYFDEYLFDAQLFGSIVTPGRSVIHADRESFGAKKRLINCFWRAMAKYMCMNYTNTKQFMNFIKTQCSLTDEEQQELNQRINDINIYNGRNKKKDKKLLSCIGRDDNLVLPNGTSIQQIYDVIDALMKKAVSERTRLLKKDMWDTLLHNADSAFRKDIRQIRRNHNIQISAMVREKIDDAISKSELIMYENNDAEMNFDKNIWKIAIFNKETFSCVSTLDFSCLHGTLNLEMKIVAKAEVQETTGKSINLRKVRNSIKFFAYAADKFKISKTSDTTNAMIVLYLNYLETDLHLTPLTLKDMVTALRYSFKVLINSNESYCGKPVSNPALRISLANTVAFINNTPPIPEEVLIELDNHVNETDYQTQLIYEVLMETGWRFSDVAALSSNCMTKKKNDETAQIFTEVSKTAERRIEKGFDPYISSEITLELYSALQNYVFDTWKDREIYDISTLFYDVLNNKAVKISAETFNEHINRICKKNKIQTIDGSYWNISTRQTRKTVAVNLITAGASLTSVQNQLGHMNPYTTSRYYAEVKRMKIGELNEEFFKKKFDILLDNDRLSRYTEEERRILYVEFSTSRRHVELGLCSLSPSEGRCNKDTMSSCSTCTKLCTGPKYLNQWEALVNDSKTLLDEFEKTYKENDIPKEEYEQYIEYKQEKKLLKHYSAVRDAIKKAADGKENSND